jgi:NADH-quinone oxidoreductase subunit D
MALCLAVEEIGKIEVPARAQAVRVVLSELARISSHLYFISRVASSVGAETVVHYVLRERERVLDLFELVSGVRFSMNFLRFGGVAADVTEGFIERVLEVSELIRQRLKEYNDLFTFSHAFLLRSRDVGILTPATARAYGVTGPSARASGINVDVRKDQPYSGYEKVDFEVSLGRDDEGALGDVHARFMVRLREIAQSIEILKQICDAPMPGAFASITVDREFKLPRGEAYARIESARGLLGCHVVSDGSEKPVRVQFRVPSQAAVAAIPSVLCGVRTEDLAPVLASLDISVAEVDR